MLRALFAICVLASTSCVTVKPWQREHLSCAAMDPQLGETAITGLYRQKVVESRAGGGLPGNAPGGGCGCTQ
jgi:hypothetical protein